MRLALLRALGLRITLAFVSATPGCSEGSPVEDGAPVFDASDARSADEAGDGALEGSSPIVPDALADGSGLDAPPESAAPDATEDAAPEDTAPGDASRSFTVWHWNIAGHTLHAGSASTGLIETMASSIVGRKADFAAVNEICGTQYSALVAALRARGWPQDPENFIRFAEARAPNTGVCANSAYGIAILSREPLGTASILSLTDEHPQEHRKMVCAPLRDRPLMRFCTTHLTPDAAWRNQQLGQVRTQLAAYRARGESLIVTGDFNIQPDDPAMDSMYAPTVNTPANRNNTGIYRELDDADPANCLGYGELTIGSNLTGGACGRGRKIDLVFVPAAEIAGAYSLDSFAIPQCGSIACSDHRMISGSVTLFVR